jgi:hypothetical protein
MLVTWCMDSRLNCFWTAQKSVAAQRPAVLSRPLRFQYIQKPPWAVCESREIGLHVWKDHGGERMLAYQQADVLTMRSLMVRAGGTLLSLKRGHYSLVTIPSDCQVDSIILIIRHEL